MLRDLGVRYIALNPGSSLRGLHDSLVNHLGNEDPQMILCLHEEHAVAIAHGYAKATGQAIAVALHSNVGLMHATMAIYNAWCDRCPVLLVGGTGPVDAAQRRPWIDWIHTAKDQAALVRQFIKWDDQPSSIGAAAQSFARAATLAHAEPPGPVYLCLDVALQEAPAPQPAAPCDLTRYVSYQAPYPPPDAVRTIARALRGAKRPVLLIGRTSRSQEGWDARVRLAEFLSAQVLTDLRVAASFPTTHPLHAMAPMRFMEPATAALLHEADAILALDWVDLGGTLDAAHVDSDRTDVFHCSLDHHVHNGWSMDHQALPRARLHVSSTVDHLVQALLDELSVPEPAEPAASRPAPQTPGNPVEQSAEPESEGITLDRLGDAVIRTTSGRRVCFARLPLGWSARHYRFTGPLDYLGTDGGAGIGSGPGIAIGAALALKDSDRLVVTVVGDGDFMMSSNAWWTAAHYRLPLLVIVNNNRTYFNDVVHQERVARTRKRPLENKWVAQQLTEPDIKLVDIAAAQGALTFGPVREPSQLDAVLEDAIQAALAGNFCVVDVLVPAQWDNNLRNSLAGAQREAGHDD
ncbi:thiamine pyrophosphate-binding protein [Verticiella sediminum]|uniref:Thiamine pyrophosphate-binding protein n=2 Tax=Verticiella sediminum TaxID=1247510 RepID=A0A556AD21_9BURK|nr:thiamine pyrophosphate-binding protein [Verticiella sediminum]